ncbi:uncharacterized protein BDV17DRAFT_266326 [Aspergillus undulatus]|uniref:uncharacterized protein n=1 Tax=Aspergillus undulatus TaxID=1810928 RepID=UPI003CCD1783
MDPTKSKPKRTPRRAAKDRYEEEKLMSSDKSQLIDLDLVRLLALPEAWNCLEEAEKREILDLLPSDTHPNQNPSPDDPDAKIPPIPEEFLRYSNNWRDGIRNFQLDLQNGRYDPQWMREAEEAVQQRATGNFDKFKEQEFEEFWGQKQKMDRYLAAGESSKIKLSTLIEHDIIRKGDIWKWSRAFGRGKTSVLIEKEARIIEVNEALLTFALPPGQRPFLKAPATADATNSNPEETPAADSKTPPISNINETAMSNGAAVIGEKTDSDTKDQEAGPSRKRSAEPDTEVTPAKRTRGCPHKKEPSLVEERVVSLTGGVTDPKPKEEATSPISPSKSKPESSGKPQNGDSDPVQETPKEKLSDNKSDATPDDKPVDESAPETNGESDEVIVPDINGPTALTNKILEVDGRIKKATNGNAWKEFRCFRDNQDMGTLWEVRHAWYVKNQDQ